MDWRIHLKLQHNIRVNEAAQEITLRSVKGDVEGIKERILSLRAEPLRCEIHRRKVSSMLEQSKRLSAQRQHEAAQGLSREMDQCADRSTHDESFFNMQNVSLKERDEDEEYPWRKPIPIEEFEVESKALPVGPITLWQAAMITKYDLMMIEFSRDERSWIILQRSKRYSVSRRFLREKLESVKFMVIVTDPRNVSSREIIKVSRDVTEALPLKCLARAPLELVPFQLIKSPVLPTPRREKKPLIVETVESEKDEVVGHDHDDRAKVDEIDKNRGNEASSSKTNADVVESKNDRSPPSRLTHAAGKTIITQKCHNGRHPSVTQSHSRLESITLTKLRSSHASRKDFDFVSTSAGLALPRTFTTCNCLFLVTS